MASKLTPSLPMAARLARKNEAKSVYGAIPLVCTMVSFAALPRTPYGSRACGLNTPSGAVGVSGAPGGDKDEACAKAAIDKVADQLK